MTPGLIDFEFDHCLERQTIALVRRRAERIVLRARPRLVEVSDVEHDLWVALLEIDPEFRRILAPATARRAIRRAARRVLRTLLAEQRCGIEQKRCQCNASTGNLQSEQDAVAITHDVAVVVAKLPWRMNRLARHLMDASSHEAAARWGVSNAAVYAMIARMRRRFMAAGFYDEMAVPCLKDRSFGVR